MAEFREKLCEACGAKLLMFPSPTKPGSWIPGQRVRAVYLVTEDRKVTKTTAENATFYVSHFETCTDPQRFSRKKRN